MVFSGGEAVVGDEVIEYGDQIFGQTVPRQLVFFGSFIGHGVTLFASDRGRLV